MKCYICKKETKTAIRHFMKAQNKREKDRFRDICDACYPPQMTKEGYVLDRNTWRKV